MQGRLTACYDNRIKKSLVRREPRKHLLIRKGRIAGKQVRENQLRIMTVNTTKVAAPGVNNRRNPSRIIIKALL